MYNNNQNNYKKCLDDSKEKLDIKLSNNPITFFEQLVNLGVPTYLIGILVIIFLILLLLLYNEIRLPLRIFWKVCLSLNIKKIILDVRKYMFIISMVYI